MSDQFISAITDEAMTRICYNGGWDLKPFKFLISESDVFSGGYGRDPWEYKDLWDNGTEATRENLKPQAFEYLKSVLTKEMQDDYTSGKVWYNARFSSISKTNEVTLCHHVNIPGDVAIDTTSKNIKTIYFVYQDNNGEDFCYGVARANGTLLFEQGISQSFFFNFTVSNEVAKEMTEFVLNYSCAHEIEDHNTTFGPEIHSNLVARDGSRNINGILEYDSNKTFTKDTQLVSKNYVDTNAVIEVVDRNISPQTQAYLKKVIKHTTNSWESTTSTSQNELHLVPFGIAPLAYYNAQNIGANSTTTFNKNGIFYVSSASVATMTSQITINGVTHSLITYGYNAIIQSGMTFSTNVAGKFIPFVGQ